MEFLKNFPHVHISLPEKVDAKLKQMAKDGLGKLMFVSDFDYTLSSYTDGFGHSCPRTRDLMKSMIIQGHPAWVDRYNEMETKYHAIESSRFKSVNEKIPYMEEWYTKIQDFVIKSHISKHEIMEKVACSKLRLRSHTADLFSKISNHDIPYLIFSKGYGDIIQTVLENQLANVPEKLHIVSNTMVFDEHDVCIGFSSPIIHTFNKNYSAVRSDCSFANQLEGRTNVILMGDSQFDIHMDMGLPDERLSLKIGFLNNDSDNLLNKYMDLYDIVIVEDQTMEVPLKIFDHILGH